MTFFGSSSGSSSSSAVTSPSTSMTPESLCQAIREKNYARIIDIIFDHPEFAGEKFEEENQTAIALAIALGDFTAQRLLLRCHLDPQKLELLDFKKLNHSAANLNTHEKSDDCKHVIVGLFKAINSDDYKRMIDILFHHSTVCDVFIETEESPPPSSNFLGYAPQIRNDTTPLHYAVSQKKLITIKLLLLFGATIDISNEHIHAPLYLAVLKCNEQSNIDLEIINILSIRGANPDLKPSSKSSLTPRELAKSLVVCYKKITAIFDREPKEQSNILLRCPSELLLGVARDHSLRRLFKEAANPESPEQNTLEAPNRFLSRRRNSE